MDNITRLRNIEQELEGFAIHALSALKEGQSLVQMVQGERGKNPHSKEKPEVKIYLDTTRLRLKTIEMRHQIEAGAQQKLQFD